MSFDKWAGDFIGVPEGLHAIGSGQAALFGFVFVALGWVISSRQQKEKFRVESARSTLMVENEKFQKYIPIISPYTSKRKQFPDLTELLTDESKKDIRGAIYNILTLVEVLSLDIATGRASERYVRESQRSMFCSIAICSQTYINSARQHYNVKRLYHNLEIAFIRLYFNRYAFFQWTLEGVLGRPLFRYSYLMFRLRYLIAGVLFGLDWNYRKEEWTTIKKHMRKMRRVKEAVLLTSALLAIAYLEFVSLT